jgi:hypothetical protein
MFIGEKSPFHSLKDMGTAVFINRTNFSLLKSGAVNEGTFCNGSISGKQHLP